MALILVRPLHICTREIIPNDLPTTSSNKCAEDLRSIHDTAALAEFVLHFLRYAE